jgi:hypothetical protein
MPGKENEEEAAVAETPLAEGRISDAEVLSALGLDENLMPIGEPRGDQAKGKPAAAKPAPKGRAAAQPQGPASGDNAGEAEEESFAEDEEPLDSPDTGEESEEAPEEEGDFEEEEESEPEREVAPKGITAMQKRIDKLTAKRHELETEVETLRGNLEKANAVSLTPSEEDPLADLESEADVEKHVQMMRQLRRWCLRNLDGGEITNSKGETLELSSQDVRTRLAHADDVIQHFGPQRLKYLGERGQFDTMARRHYPELFETSSPAAKMMADFLRRCPEIMKVPNYRMIIGDAIRGMNVRLAVESKNGGKSAGTAANGQRPLSAGTSAGPKLAPRAVKPGVAPLQTTRKAGGASARLERQFLSSGSKQDLEAYIASTL